MKSINGILTGLTLAAMLTTAGTGSAQPAATLQDAFAGINLTASPGSISLNVEDVAAIKSLSDEQLGAFATALTATPTIPASALPRGGMGIACWSLQNPSMPPLPGNTIGVDVWVLSDGSLLLNDVNFDYDSLSAVSPVAGPQMRMGAMGADDISPPGAGNDDGSTNGNWGGADFKTRIFTTNDLWLEITGFTNHRAAFVIHSPWDDTNLFHD